MARQKNNPDLVVVKTKTDVNNALQELAGLERSLKVIEVNMNDEIDKLKAQAKEASQALNARKTALSSALEVYATFNKDAFEDRRSQEYAHGTIGWRKSTKLGLLPKFTWSQVLGKLKELDFRTAIKTKEDISKEDLETWPSERLKLVGVERQVNDTFWWEIKAEELPSAA